MAMWNPWRGCKKCSEGCLHCYIHKGDAKRGIDTNQIVITKDFKKPVEKLKNGNYKMKSGLVYTCFSTDFLIEEADDWRDECWRMMYERKDCTFLFLTKRMERFVQCIPDNWGDGYNNVVVCCTVENQKNADYKLGILKSLPIKHKCITAQPLLENIHIEQYLKDIELVVVGGESDSQARILDYSWVLDIREQCIRNNVSLKYGYDSPTAFNRAFQRIHGIAPSEARGGIHSLKAYPPISFKISIKGDCVIDYRIEKKEAFRIIGVSAPLEKEIEKNFEVVSAMWGQTAQNGTIEKLANMMDGEVKGLLGVSSCNEESDWKYYIAVASNFA